MGEPKATDIPAAAAAEKTSRFLARKSVMSYQNYRNRLTFVIIDITEKFHEYIGGTASNVYKRTFLS
jgi:hypothetical protein